MFGEGCDCGVCAGDVQGDPHDYGCEYVGIDPVAGILYRSYLTYLQPPATSSFDPQSRPRASLIDLPYRLREVAEMVDTHRMNSQAAEYRDRKETQKTREMMKNAGIPL